MPDYLAQQDSTVGIGGLKNEPIPPFSGSSGAIGIGPVFQMLFALGLVVVLIRFVVPKILKRVTKRTLATNSSDIRVIESSTVGAGQLHLVDVRGRTILLGSTAQTFSLLADVTDESTTSIGFPTPSLSTPNDAPGTSFDEMLGRLNRLGS